MKFEGTTVFGIENALIGMRLPMCKDFEEAKQKRDVEQNNVDLCKRLIKADEKGCGQPNSKFLRMMKLSMTLSVRKSIQTYGTNFVNKQSDS